MKNKLTKNKIKNIFKIKNKLIVLSSIFILSLTVIYSCNLIFADTSLKQKRYESVYIELDNSGNKKSGTMYVETTLNGTKQIVDYGKYSYIENMTNKIKESFDKDNNLVWNLNDYKGESFSYNTKLDDKTFINIPYNIEMRYELNGKEIDPNKLAHQNGLVRIFVDITPNKNANSFYKNNYMMEVTADFDLNDYISVSSDDAIELITGKTKTLMYVVLPGAESHFDIMLGAEDFKYDGLTFAIMPISGNVSDKIVDLIKDRDDLKDAYNSTMEGTSTVLNALSNMKTGLNNVNTGLNNLRTGTIKMHDLKGNRDITVNELDNEISALNSSLDNTLLDLTEYKKYLSNLESDLDVLKDEIDDLEKIANDIPSLAKNSRVLIKDARKVVSLLGDTPSDNEEELAALGTKFGTELTLLSKLSSGDIDMITYGAMSPYTLAASDIVTNAEFMNDLQKLLLDLNDLSSSKNSLYTSIYNDLGTINNDLKSLEDNGKVFGDVCETGYSMTDTLYDLLKYTNKKGGGYDNLTDLITALSKMTNTLNNAMPNIKNALNILSTDLYNGAINTVDGLSNVTADLSYVTSQAQTFMVAKDKIDNVIRTNYDDINDKTTLFELDPKAKKVSFSSDKNIEPERIQIFMKSPEIKEVVDDDMAVFTKENEHVGFFKKILSLFTIMWDWICGLFS